MKGIKREIADLERKVRDRACSDETIERRQQRLEQLKAKLERDSRPQSTGDLVWDALLGYQKKVDRYFKL